MTNPPNRRTHIQVRGIVQGVGFRPFVYKLARSLGLAGYVFNSSSGVTIEIEGGGAEVEGFLKALREDPPQLAEITEITQAEMQAQGSAGFSILGSREQAGEFALVPPDAGTCDACWRDFADPSNRRYGYPFTNCTHCGPRYTIIRDLPYDRATTTMLTFVMCDACQSEYEDPLDRRFHAQPNACAVCGPSLLLAKSVGGMAPDLGTRASLGDCWFRDKDSLPIIRQARALLREGKIVAVKGLGGFLLACDAANESAVAELRTRKRRPHKPFALMVRDLEAARRVCA
jgi:hydrogenase maturation protein HypF